MDRISRLSDDLLVKILSFLPTKVAVSTSVLSKRWEFLWMWLPQLEFISRSDPLSVNKSLLRCFLDRNLPLHRAPVIESFRLNIVDPRLKPEDIKLWIVLALSRYLCELEVSYYAYRENYNILPSSLYTSKSLVTLKLDGTILLDVPRMVGLPSLKTLQLQRVKLDGKSLLQLLSICPVLEDLVVNFRGRFENIGMITVIVSSLQSLSLCIPFDGSLDGIVIDTPSLRYLKLEDYKEDNHSCLIKHMPKLEEAHVDVNFSDIESLIGSITSLKFLTLASEAVYSGCFVFNKLEHLKLCVCTKLSSNLLVRLLESSPCLRVLDFIEMDHKYDDMVCWNQPSTVPECVMSCLQIFNWSGYLGSPQERDLVVYILKNARVLKTATISSDESFIPKLEMIKELTISPRASTTCQLVFD